MYKGERFNSISHLVGAVFALAGFVLLIVDAAIQGGAIRVVSFTIFGFTLFLLYLSSTLYHSFPGRLKNLFRIFDYQAIYLLIAGTYTPIVLVGIEGNTGWWMFGAIWSLALIGIIFDAFPRTKHRLVPVILCIVMGWLCVFAFDALKGALQPECFYWLLAGGIFYSAGVLFFILDHWYPWCHGVWHIFVLAGSLCHYISILFYL